MRMIIIMRMTIILLCALVLTGTVTGCGKRGDPMRPSEVTEPQS